MKSDVKEVKDWFKTRLEPYLKTNANYLALDKVEIENMQHWLEQYPDKSLISQFSVEKVKNSTDKWMKKLQDSGAQVIESDKDVKVIKDLGDEMFLVKLLTPNAFKYEGNKMSHCVASYVNSDSDIYSIRDGFNKPHCTIEVSDGSISQIKGKGNKFVVTKYVKYVLSALEHLNCELDTSDLSNLGLIEVNKEEVEYLRKITNNEVPLLCINGTQYVNNADSYWDKIARG